MRRVSRQQKSWVIPPIVPAESIMIGCTVILALGASALLGILADLGAWQ